jgi:hypothetical protein
MSTLDEIKIDRSDEDENADDSIRVNRELDSNEIECRQRKSEKSFGNIIEIDSGIHVRIIPASSSVDS